MQNHGVEHIVDLPMPREFEAIVDLPQDFLDREWPKASISEFVRRVSGAKVPSLQPNAIPLLIFVISRPFPQDLLCRQNGLIRLLSCLEELLLSPLELDKLAGSRGLMRMGNRPHP